MAGGGSLGGGLKQKRGDQGKRKAKKRVGFHLDMTPLVDITFLLLTFFMFTTTMLKPQIMEIKVPPESVPIDVKASALLSIFVTDSNTVYWRMGEDEPEKIDLKETEDGKTTYPLRRVVIDKNLEPELLNETITSLKVAPKANYGFVVNILDELNLAEQTVKDEIIGMTKPDGTVIEERKRKFSVTAMTKEEEELIQTIENPEAQANE